MLRIVDKYDVMEATDECALICYGESMTHQEFKEECDINTIIERFGIGENPIEPQKWVTDLDIANAPDNYMDVMNQLNAARDQFMSLPAKVRSQFDNDPAKFVSFVSDANNIEEMIRMGLATRVENPKPSDTDRIIEAISRGAQSSS